MGIGANIGVTIANWAQDSVASVGPFSRVHCSERNIQRYMKRFLMTAITLFSLVAALAPAADSNFGVGAQYDTTHVYVQPQDFDKFVASLVATFGGSTTKEGVFTVTPTPSETMSQLVLTPAGTLSVFGFKTPVPYPFGAERTGYLVTNLDAAL